MLNHYFNQANHKNFPHYIAIIVLLLNNRRIIIIKQLFVGPPTPKQGNLLNIPDSCQAEQLVASSIRPNNGASEKAIAIIVYLTHVTGTVTHNQSECQRPRRRRRSRRLKCTYFFGVWLWVVGERGSRRPPKWITEFNLTRKVIAKLFHSHFSPPPPCPPFILISLDLIKNSRTALNLFLHPVINRRPQQTPFTIGRGKNGNVLAPILPGGAAAAVGCPIEY